MKNSKLKQANKARARFYHEILKLKKTIKKKDIDIECLKMADSTRSERLHRQDKAIISMQKLLDLAHNQLKAEKAQTERTEQHIISCENANNELHAEIMQLKGNYNLLSVKFESNLRINAINEQAIISCENANNELHDKLDAYRVVLKDLNNG